MTTPFDTLFTAVDVSALAGKTSTLMIAVVGCSLLFMGYGVIRKLMKKGA